MHGSTTAVVCMTVYQTTNSFANRCMHLKTRVYGSDKFNNASEFAYNYVL